MNVNNNCGRARGWCFTINNWTEADLACLADLGNQKSCIYLIYGKETGENNTPHLQGYVFFANARTLPALKKIHKTAHWELSRGNHQQNFDYINKGLQPKSEWEEHGTDGPNYGKDADVTIFGEMPQKANIAGGEATKEKFERTKQLAKEGKIDEIDADHYIKYYNTLQKIANDHLNHLPNIDGRCGIWLMGKPKLGKSRFAREKYLYDEGKLYWKGLSKWWDGYRHEPFVLIEDIQPALPNINSLAYQMKIWTDMYAFNGERKGGMINIRPQRIVVTSNYTVDQVFGSVTPFDQTLINAMKTRFIVVDFDSLFNVRQLPPALYPNAGFSHTGVDYLFDEYDFDRINASMPPSEWHIGKPPVVVAAPATPLPLCNVYDGVSGTSNSDDELDLLSTSTYHRSTATSVRRKVGTMKIGVTAPKGLSLLSAAAKRASPLHNLNLPVQNMDSSQSTSAEPMQSILEKDRGLSLSKSASKKRTLDTKGGFRALASTIAKYSELAEEEYSVSAKDVGHTKPSKAKSNYRPLEDSDLSESEGEDCQEELQTLLNYKTGDYDLDDDFIASDDDFENVCVKRRKPNSPLPSLDVCTCDTGPDMITCQFCLDVWYGVREDPNKKEIRTNKFIENIDLSDD